MKKNFVKKSFIYEDELGNVIYRLGKPKECNKCRSRLLRRKLFRRQSFRRHPFRRKFVRRKFISSKIISSDNHFVGLCIVLMINEVMIVMATTLTLNILVLIIIIVF